MRLSEHETAALREALTGVEHEGVVLFRPRADPARRGGDVEIPVRARGAAFDLAHRIARRYAQRMESRPGVLVVDPDSPTPEQGSFIAALTLESLNDHLRA